MPDVKETFSIQRAKQLIDSKFQSFRWETMPNAECVEYLANLMDNIRIYHKIRTR